MIFNNSDFLNNAVSVAHFKDVIRLDVICLKRVGDTQKRQYELSAINDCTKTGLKNICVQQQGGGDKWEKIDSRSVKGRLRNQID